MERSSRVRVLMLAASLANLLGCKGERDRMLVPESETFAELRTVRRGVLVVPPKSGERVPYGRERLVDGERIVLRQGALAWLRRDGGATLLLSGPARTMLHATGIDVTEGRVFVDTQASATAELSTPRGAFHLAKVRASIDVTGDGRVEVYVLSGGVHSEAGLDAGAGELLTLWPDGRKTKTSAVVWDDWTGGLATTDRAAEPSPFGIGTVGARSPGDQGKARFALAIQRLDVRVTVDRDFATTEVDEVFFNPTHATVEGIYTFRTPPGAVLGRFGVDRNHEIVWGRVKERQAAAAQYQANVYQGSTEDPALLEWDAPGVYKARLYPIKPGETRRVVTRYGEWLSRQGARGERRLYVYPMAAEGAEATLPRIEELTIDLDLSRAGAKEARVGMQGKRTGDRITVKAFDHVPRADFALELFDDGARALTAYRAPHSIDPELLTPEALPKARADAKQEADYVIVPLRPSRATEPPGGLDLAIVIDSSAATDRGALAVARAMTGALLAHLGPDDRAAVWAGDATLRPVADGSGQLGPMDGARREAVANGLAQIDRGGATDLGTMIAEAASKLDGARRGAVVYIGDGQPTVGEIAVAALRERLSRLARPVRLFAIGIGDNANLGILKGLASGGLVERVTDAFGAARSALRVLEEAERPVWLGATVDLGAGIDRVFPRELGALAADETVLVVGRVAGELPKTVTVRGSGGETVEALSYLPLADAGDLRRRWAERRLGQLLEQAAGRAAVVEVGVRSGIITPFTSFYVPTAAEVAAEHDKRVATRDEESTRDQSRGSIFALGARARPASPVEVLAEADSKEGGTGTRAKGEEGSMGNPQRRAAVRGPSDMPAALPAAVAAATAAPPAQPASPRPGSASKSAGGAKGGPADNADPHIARQGALREAAEFGMIGLLDTSGGGDPNAPTAPWGRDDVGDAVGSGGLGLTGIGEGGGGKGDGIGLGQGFGSGHGRLGGAPSVEKKPEAKDKGVKLKVEAEPARPSQPLVIGAAVHQSRRCSAAADLPVEERRALWRERLAAAGTNVRAILRVYDGALAVCEAPTWRERQALLIQMVEGAGSIRTAVALWRYLVIQPAAADAVYRAILTRVHTAAELRELHEALGLKQLDPSLLAKSLDAAKTPEAKVAVLRDLAQAWPDDLELALRLLDAYEDAGDDGGGRALARRLRLRADANTRVRTEVGEYYLRRAAKEPVSEAARDTAEARRTFGEIVEFAPEDPAARRRLGDLLSAHGWYDEAFRQYDTLSHLTPDDSSVPLLLAIAAQGMGKTEEAVRWTEKSSVAGSPDSSSAGAKTARSLASAFLAWSRDEAARAGRKDEADRLRERARRLAALENVPAGAAKVVLTWSHPELHAELWSASLGPPLPALAQDPLLGVAEALVALDPGAFVELRLDKEDEARAARLGLTAVLTAIVDEGTPGERIARRVVSFGKPGAHKFKIESGSMLEEVL